MIDAGPSLKAAERLRAADVLTYLIRNGWSSRPSRVDGISLLSKAVPGADRPAEFILPIKPGFDEEQKRIADAIRIIGQIEDRSEIAIADQIIGGIIESGKSADELRDAEDVASVLCDQKQS